MSRRAADKNVICRLMLVFVLAIAGVFSATAAPNYFVRTWQVEQGLPQNKATAVVQTRDGYLWVGTYNGLARFDGVRFTVFDDHNTPELHSRRITSLFEDDDGTLWIGTESGDVSQYKAGHFASVPLRANWRGGKIYAITTDNLGDVWLLNEAGELARPSDGKVLSPPAGSIAKVMSLARDSKGTIWVGREGMVSALRDGRLTAELATNLYVQGFCAARDGGFWVACNGGIRKWKDGRWTADLGAAPWGWNIVANLLETSSGALAAGTAGDGLWLMFPNQTNAPVLHFNHSNGLPSDWIISLCEDREKNLWCGSGGGVALLRPNNLETVTPPDNWRSCPVLSVLPAPDGALWVGTEGAGLYRLQNGNWTNFNLLEGLRNPYVWSLAADQNGKIWAGTWGGGLFEQKGEAFDFAAGLEKFLSPVPALLFVGDELWIGTPDGVLCYKDSQLKRFDTINGSPFGDVRAIARDKSGVMWFGTAGSGLVRLQNGKLFRFRKAEGLSSDFIECLHFTEDGALWIGTFGGGLDRFQKGKFSVINLDQGLPNSVIGHIESDGNGFLWISSFGGILRANEKDLNRCANGEIASATFLTYGINEGMPTLECSEGLQSAGCKTADGRLWFATAKGLVAVDPAGVKLNTLPPPVRIEAIRMDDKTFAGNTTAGRIEVPPGRHRIEFQYTGLSFVAPEKVQFKYRLNGLESNWEDAGTKRMAIYNYIPPGNYSFQVTACNNDGFWSDTGASLRIEVLPFFWQTTWFHVLGGLVTVLAASGIGWFDTRRRMRRRLERAERQRDIERERTRIARDIHDDLGAQLTRITMLSESASEPDVDPYRAAEGIRRIYDTARELTRSMDEIVWAVNPRHDTLESLATYLEKYAHDWLAGVGIRCRLGLPLQFPEWHLNSEARHNIFLAFKEALHNAVKHSGASEVFIRLALKGDSFNLAVEDNGRGFAAGEKTKPASATPGRVVSGNGLENMRRRLAVIGGDCEIQSALGVGTKVIFSLKISASAPGNL